MAVAFKWLSGSLEQSQSSSALLVLAARAIASNGFSAVPICSTLASGASSPRWARPILMATASVLASVELVVLAIAFEMPSILPLAPINFPRVGLLNPEG